VLRGYRRAQADIGSRNQDVGGFELRDGRGRRSRFPSAGEQRRDAAGNDGDDKNDDTRGFHTLTSYAHAAAATRLQLPTDARPTRGRACRISAGKGQSMVNEAYPNRVNGL